MKQKIEAIDLFCGIGGLTYGLQQAGITVLAGLDNDKSCQYSYEKNNKSEFICADIAKYDFTEMKKMYSPRSTRVLVGCAPCQPFSSYVTRLGVKNKDSRWGLLNYFVKAIEVLNPHVISIENVRGIVKTQVFRNFVKNMNSLGYHISYEIVNCADYGVPQYRKRLVLLGSRFGEIDLIPKTHSNKHIPINKVIKKLPTIKAGEICKNDKIHKARSLSPINIKRIKQSKPSGSWKSWDKNLLPKCYKKEGGNGYQNVYGRMSWDKPSPALTTQFLTYSCGRFGHPSQNRALSIREGAMLQTFPRKYIFKENCSISKISSHIGNAVPPRLGKIIGTSIKKHLG